MEIPTYIQAYSDHIKKPVSDFSKTDWRKAAIGAGELIDNRWPEAKRKGRPPKTRPLSDLLKIQPPKEKRRRGRPPQMYYGYPIEVFARILERLEEKLVEPAVKKKWPNASIRKMNLLKSILQQFSLEAGATKHDPSAVARAIRRVKTDTNSS